MLFDSCTVGRARAWVAAGALLCVGWCVFRCCLGCCWWWAPMVWDQSRGAGRSRVVLVGWVGCFCVSGCACLIVCVRLV